MHEQIAGIRAGKVSYCELRGATSCVNADWPCQVTELRSVGIDAVKVADTTFFRAEGCERCGGSGYRGRRGIYELLQMDNTLREMTFRGEPMVRLREYAWQSGGMSTLLQDGVRKVLSGQTTIPELLRVVAAV